MKITLEELQVFLSVADSVSLSAAAQKLDQPVSTVSRVLARLEDKLQTTLISRTTRRLHLTDEGSSFVEDARNIVSAAERAEERVLLRRGQPAGSLRVDAATPVMLHVLAPLLPGYHAKFPEVRLQLSSNEGFVDLLEQRIDLAIRVGELKDSSLHSRLLCHSPMRVLASPSYLARHGMPEKVSDLAQHVILGFSHPSQLNVWPLPAEHVGTRFFQARPTLGASSGETLRALAVQGMGITAQADFMTHEDRATGRLVEVLAAHRVELLRPVHAVYYQHTAVSARIASMVQYLANALPGAPGMQRVQPARRSRHVG
ncbi:LysR family transcriptional regulator [Lampropedia cohaerens]|uniref:LysR family transcriptional regulator n=1 Tax=Lampropedia cohaerens TaxID=1610491 RepID=A0A0U1PXD5_9BURK|nr:LysR family transcriptional regulator [Lampropedia cohaerens]KKW67141.1 LysR family transcriptional regulator [Lampropedia cohaerens]